MTELSRRAVRRIRVTDINSVNIENGIVRFRTKFKFKDVVFHRNR